MVFSESHNFSNSFASLPDAFYSKVRPTPFEQPSTLIHLNQQAAQLLDLQPEQIQSPEGVDLFSGRRVHPQCNPLSMLYSGHQFGHYVPQLGDGRAIILAEIINKKNQRWEIQLKGSGPTPYSRDGDGRAVLRSTIREYLCSEAMAGLGIPTTRALCIVGSDDEVYREQIETGAVLTRLAPSHVRFGSFEVFFYRDQHDHLATLADYVINHHYPEFSGHQDRFALFFESVVVRTAKLIAQWQAVGFAHGVMNTDNMSILGLTLDYGPFGFMEGYDPFFICNHSDYQGRYAFNQQPKIAYWNLTCLAQALSPLMEIEQAKQALSIYPQLIADEYHQRMVEKFGFQQVSDSHLQIIEEFLAQVYENKADYTNTMRALGEIQTHANIMPVWFENFKDQDRIQQWLVNYRSLLKAQSVEDNERRHAMNQVNPKFILRNYMAQVAIENAQQKNYSDIDQLLNILRRPFDEHPEFEPFTQTPEWGQHIQVSCSS